ncbi:MAG: ATP-binding protein [Thermodesulfobacteriota bacterium]|nr:ATP-binding protein [Thermodesulfobacteriota bacterium]
MEHNRRILIVDDESEIRNLYKKILSRAKENEVIDKGMALFEEAGVKEDEPDKHLPDFEVSLAETGEKGLQLVKDACKNNCRFAAAFIDMKMPGMDGGETTKLIWERDPDIKIAIVTAYSEYSADHIVKITGRDDLFYLRKPFTPDEIKQFARAFTRQWDLEQERVRLSSALEIANKELADFNKNLATKVKEQSDMLVQSEKMVSIGILAAGLAHEINNPLSFVKSNISIVQDYSDLIMDYFKQYLSLENLLETKGITEIQNLLEGIQKYEKEHDIEYVFQDLKDLAKESMEGVMRIANIVSDLKSFVRIEDKEFKRVGIDQVIDKAINIIWHELKIKADIIKDYETIPDVECMSQKICQVTMNLLMNACQAFPHGTRGEIKIAIRNLSLGKRESDQKVEIKISDNGSGISSDALSKIFNPFYTTKPVGEGTGLGLSISYDIIAAHHGTIKVESKEGRGTLFTIILPLFQQYLR